MIVFCWICTYIGAAALARGVLRLVDKLGAAVGERQNGVPEAPCRGCTMRCVGCHGMDERGGYRCAAYGAYQAELDKLRAARQEAKDTADVLRWYIRARTARLLQKRNLHEKGR